jgi:hypothetical protein
MFFGLILGRDIYKACFGSQRTKTRRLLVVVTGSTANICGNKLGKEPFTGAKEKVQFSHHF